MSPLKGCMIVIICLICAAGIFAQDGVKSPLVLSANEVPVLGGRLEIIGQNFGDNANAISVYIHNSDKSVFACNDVQIVARDTAISCAIVEIGTGSLKHIEVVVNGVSNDAGSVDVNLAFKRSAPSVDQLAYNDAQSVVKVHGHHFGFNPSLVTVKLDGVDHRVVEVNDSIITCKKHGSYYVYAGSMEVYVEVDSQNSNVTNLDLILESEYENVIGTSMLEVQNEDAYAAQESNKYKTIVLVFIPVLAAVALVAGLLAIKRRRMMLAASTRKDISSAEQAGCNGAAIMISSPPMVRDSSMEEIDLHDNVTTATTTTQQVEEDSDDNDIYDLHRSDSSSSFSSLSSTYSSASCTPTSYTPDTPSSPRLDSSEFNHHNKRSMRREQLMSTIALDEPISRLGKRSMDSPYFAKQNPFDSPLSQSTEVTPCGTPGSSTATPTRRSSLPRGMPHPKFDSPLRSSQESTPRNNSLNNSGSLANSQEINSQHTNPFDSACVLHSAIQRAAILREKQKQQKQTTKQQAAQPSLLPGRRASLSGAGYAKSVGRRSSLSTTSLHVTALHNSTGITKYSERQQPTQKQLPLRASQYIHQIDEELVEGDE